MMTQKWRGWVLAGIALTMYLTGGVLIMAGLIMIGMMGSQDVWGWGEARGIGYMAFAIGIILSVFGVLVMRIMRNRGW
ncbi:MAG: hypothetical protein RQ722_12465 [Desulfuromonadales bacterium]|nr:hypothetical protein [Desulfuromonadales bacterium]